MVIVLRVHWCNNVLNVHAPSEEKSNDSKDSFYDKLKRVFYHFSKHHIKILLGKFNAKLGTENIFRLRTGNKSLHGNKGVGVVDFVTSTRCDKVPHQFSCTETFINTPGHLLQGEITTRLTTYWQTGDYIPVYCMSQPLTPSEQVPHIH